MTEEARSVDDYRHERARRLNNPTAALAREDVEEVPERKYDYDSRFPPELWWAGKDQDAEFEVEAPSIHIHEMLAAEAIVAAARREEPQLEMFGDPRLERAKAVEFYQHETDWKNRLILGDSLVVMASLAERERLAGQVGMVYLDPPYGINYNSNFQARISNRSPSETKDESLTREPEQIQAYRDTWQLGIHSYLSYLRSRFVAARELLADDGSIFVQIGPENVHRVRVLLDEVFGPDNACTMIVATTTSGLGASLLPDVHTHLLWYAKDRSRVKYRQLYAGKEAGGEGGGAYTWVELPGGERRRMTAEERADPDRLPEGARPYTLGDMTSQGFRPNTTIDYEFEGKTFHPGQNQCWKTTKEGLDNLAELGRLQTTGNTLRYVRFLDDLPGRPLKNVWTDMGRAGFGAKKRYVVETVPKLIARCMLMATDPGDLVLDPTCGSGTTPYVAEQYGRRWVAVDTSRVALSLARERIVTAHYPWYELVDEEVGVDAGLRYERIERVTLGSLAHGRGAEEIALHDRPLVDHSRVRVSGPFTVEALSRYAEDPFRAPDSTDGANGAADHVAVLLEALRTRGIPRREGEPAEVVSLTPLAGSDILHAEGTFRDEQGAEQAFAVSLGPRHGAITPLQVDDALQEAPGYRLIVFAGFAATAEAQEYLAPGKRGRVNVALLEANPDLLLGDLLKTTKASQTFRLFSAPDVRLHPEEDGQFSVEVAGMDSFDSASGEVTSRGSEEIAAWLLDTDYDGTVFHANQAFFTRDDAWDALGRALGDAVDPEVMEQLASLCSLPFERPPSGRVAVRVIDDAGSTSERVLAVGD